MTYLPQVEIPEWMKFVGNMCAYLFACCSYMLILFIAIQLFNIINVSLGYCVAAIGFLFMTLMIVVKVESCKEPYDGW